MLACLASLCAVARFHEVAADPVNLAHQRRLSPSSRFEVDDLLRAARHLGLKARRSRTTASRLLLTPLPALAAVAAVNGGLHVVIVAHADAQRLLLQDPGTPGGRPTIESMKAFTARWTGELFLITSRASLAGNLARFDFSWFVPSLVKYRRLLGEALLIFFMLQLFGLVSPLFFPVVMDKVLVHRGLTTLDVLVLGPKQRHPAWDMVARYRAIFVAAWAQPAELASPARLANEAAFLPAALSLQGTWRTQHRAACPGSSWRFFSSRWLGPSSCRSTSWRWRRARSLSAITPFAQPDSKAGNESLRQR